MQQAKMKLEKVTLKNIKIKGLLEMCGTCHSKGN